MGANIRLRSMMWAINNGYRAAATASKWHPLSNPRRHGVEVIRDVPYHPDRRRCHMLDIYVPSRTPEPWPVILYVHGGSFGYLSKDTHWIMGLAFARRGYLVFNINYRLAPRHPFPAGLIDTCTALEWVLQSAHLYGGDVGRLGFAGESAGAHLVTALTLLSCYERRESWARRTFELGVVPGAVLPACGMHQVSDPERFATLNDRMPGWVVENLCEVSRRYLGPGDGKKELADPLLILEGDEQPSRLLPPFCAVVGTSDPLLDDTRRLASALTRLGAPCEAHYYKGEPHAFHAFVFMSSAKRCWRDQFDFLNRYLPDRRDDAVAPTSGKSVRVPSKPRPASAREDSEIGEVSPQPLKKSVPSLGEQGA